MDSCDEIHKHNYYFEHRPNSAKADGPGPAFDQPDARDKKQNSRCHNQYLSNGHPTHLLICFLHCCPLLFGHHFHHFAHEQRHQQAPETAKHTCYPKLDGDNPQNHGPVWFCCRGNQYAGLGRRCRGGHWGISIIKWIGGHGFISCIDRVTEITVYYFPARGKDCTPGLYQCTNWFIHMLP